MALEIFLKLDGITGESQKDGHQDEIEIFSFSNGASNTSSVAMGTGSGAGKVDLSSISFQKQVDTASPQLFQACCSGKHIATGKLTCREAGGDSTVDYFTYDLSEVFIDSVSWGGAEGGGGKPSESVSLSAKKLVVTYLPQNADGTQGTKQQGGWDVSLNKAASA
jgi:type VI secretion system secreted protein Hcp